MLPEAANHHTHAYLELASNPRDTTTTDTSTTLTCHSQQLAQALGLKHLLGSEDGREERVTDRLRRLVPVGHIARHPALGLGHALEAVVDLLDDEKQDGHGEAVPLVVLGVSVEELQHRRGGVREYTREARLTSEARA